MRYTELIEKHQKEFNKFPLGFAFSWEQFKEMMGKWGLDPKNDLDKISRLSNYCGGFIRKKDIPAYKELTERLNKEMKEAMQDDVLLGFKLKDINREDEEDYYNEPKNFDLTEHQLVLYELALMQYFKNIGTDY